MKRKADASAAIHAVLLGVHNSNAWSSEPTDSLHNFELALQFLGAIVTQSNRHTMRAHRVVTQFSARLALIRRDNEFIDEFTDYRRATIRLDEGEVGGSSAGEVDPEVVIGLAVGVPTSVTTHLLL